MTVNLLASIRSSQSFAGIRTGGRLVAYSPFVQGYIKLDLLTSWFTIKPLLSLHTVPLGHVNDQMIDKFGQVDY